MATPGAGPAAPAAPPAAPELGIAVPKDISDILLTIRLMESGSRYHLPTIPGGASGAYQFIDSTWNNYRGYPKAYLAPPWVQDERAALDVQSILDRFDGDVSMVPVIWYYPIAATHPELMDRVPKPEYGNRLTIREYQFRWLDMLEYVVGAPLGFRLALLPPEIRFLSGIPPELPDENDPLTEIAYPVLGRSVLAVSTPCPEKHECEPGAAAVIYAQQLQPVRAVVDGVVTGLDRGDAASGAVTLTLTDPAGRTYHYAGFNDDTPGTDDGSGHPALQFTSLADVGTAIRAGQILGFVGNTDPMPTTEHLGLGDEPVWPHLRLTIRDVDGVRLDADRLVAAAQRDQACHVGIGPWSMPPDADYVQNPPTDNPPADDEPDTNEPDTDEPDTNQPDTAEPDTDEPDTDELPARDERRGHQLRAGETVDDEAIDDEAIDDRAVVLEPFETVDVSTPDDGGWTIHDDGTVTALGKSALVLPPDDCTWAPDEPFGPGAAGNLPAEVWVDPVDVPLRHWISGVIGFDAENPIALRRG